MNESIKKGIGIFAFATIAIILLSGIGAAADKNYGEYLDQYKGVSAYSSGSCIANYIGNCANLPVYNKYQCVEYVIRFYSAAIKIDTSSWVGSGNAATYYGSASTKGLMSFPNGGSERPKPDDILAFSGGTGGYGHVAIITEVTDTYVKVIEQNWARNDAIHQIRYNKATNIMGSTNKYRPGTNYYIQGWLRKEAVVLTSPNGAEVWSRLSPQTVKWKYYGDPGSSVIISVIEPKKRYTLSIKQT